MAPTSLLLFLISSVMVMLPAATEDRQGRKHCTHVVCGSLTTSYPFWLVSEEATETNDCGLLGFQVLCYGNSTAFLQGLQILNISYNKASLLVTDFKLYTASKGCQAPSFNSSTKISMQSILDQPRQ
ncbi:unnamed protein product [Urochloa humidicola]